jgi:hypothetical protein
MLPKFFRLTPFLILLLIISLSAFCQSEEEPPTESPPELPTEPQFGWGLNLGLGVTTFDEKTYQKIAVSPEFSFGKFGIAFDLLLHIRYANSELEIRKEDWVPDDVTFVNVMRLYLSKFRYIRYGYKGNPLYIKFGSIDDATLGNGFVMGNYANTLFLPETRIFGLAFDLDGKLFKFPYIGLETFVSDVASILEPQDFDVFGARFYVRPIAFIKKDTVLKDLQLGTSFVADFNPFRYADSDTLTDAQSRNINTDDAKVWILDVDFREPILSTKFFSLDLFGDIATIKFNSYGGMTGIGGRIVKFLTYGAQIRIIGDNFVPVYFDSTYDITRTQKFYLIEGLDSSEGYIGWLASLGFILFKDRFYGNVTLEGPFGRIDDNEDNYLNYPHMTGILAVTKGLIPWFSFLATYDKKLIREFRDLFRAEGVVLKLQINYHINAAVISFYYMLRYDENDWDNPEIVSGLEASIQLGSTGGSE